NTVFQSAFLDTMRVIPGAIKTLAFGRIQTPNYLQADASMIPFPTYSGSPTQLGTVDLYFELMLPSEDCNPQRRKPPGGWPVVIWGHANNENGVNGSQSRVAAVFASHCIATLSWNQVGYGFGPNSTVTIAQTDTSLTFPFAGRTYDLNHPDSALSSPGGFIEFRNTPGRRGPVAGLMLKEHNPSLLNPLGTPLITKLGVHDSQAQLSDGPGLLVTAEFYNENMPERGLTPIVNCS